MSATSVARAVCKVCKTTGCMIFTLDGHWIAARAKDLVNRVSARVQLLTIERSAKLSKISRSSHYTLERNLLRSSRGSKIRVVARTPVLPLEPTPQLCKSIGSSHSLLERRLHRLSDDCEFWNIQIALPATKLKFNESYNSICVSL